MRQKERKKIIRRLVVQVLLFTIAAWFFFFALTFLFFPESKEKDLGEMFGAIESIFTVMAFAGVIATIWIQQKTNNAQSFENTFFQFLSFYNQILSEMVIEKEGKNGVFLNGRSAFTEIISDFLRNYVLYVHHAEGLRKTKTKEEIKEATGSKNAVLNEVRKKAKGAFQEFFKGNQDNLGHYYRTVNEILKAIDESEVSDKQHYANILRAQLSSGELIFLYYEVLSSYDLEFNKLVFKFNLLKHLPVHSIGKVDASHLKIYQPGSRFTEKDKVNIIEELIQFEKGRILAKKNSPGTNETS